MIVEVLVLCLIVALFMMLWGCSRRDFKQRGQLREYRETILQIRKQALPYTEYYGEVSYAMHDIVKLSNEALEDKPC